MAVGIFSRSGPIVVYALYSIAIFILPALFADAIYYRFCRRQIAWARASDLVLSPAAQKALLSKAGGTWNLALVIGVIVAATGAIAAYVNSEGPRYAAADAAEELAYIEEASRARLDSVVGFGAAAGKALTDFHRHNGKLPRVLAETSMGTLLPPEVQHTQIDPVTGELKVALAIGSLEGRSLRFAPYTDSAGAIQWQCHAGALPRHLIPEGCTAS